jgi:hypothetical protein
MVGSTRDVMPALATASRTTQASSAFRARAGLDRPAVKLLLNLGGLRQPRSRRGQLQISLIENWYYAVRLRCTRAS